MVAASLEEAEEVVVAVAGKPLPGFRSPRKFRAFWLIRASRSLRLHHLSQRIHFPL